MDMIDYGRLDRSVKFYEDKGFKRIESPWTVTKEISAITKPIGKVDWEIVGKDKVLVASGEQSFLYLYLKGFLPKGKYQTITPCFREESFDKTHTKYFIKNELIITDDVTKETLKSVINDCKQFYESELNCSIDFVKTDEDALQQGNKIMMLVELSDLIGSIEGYCENHNMTLDDLIKMKEATKRAFGDGTRKSR